MRGVKLGLIAVLAAAALTMGAGAGSAAAATTAFCEVNSSPSACPTLSTYAAYHHFEVRGEAAFSGITSCSFVYMFESAANRSTSPLLTKLWYWEFYNCTGGHRVESLSLPAPFRFTTTGSGPNGIGKYEPWTSEPFKIDGSCIYDAAVIPQSVSGGTVFTASGVTLSLASGTLCPSTVKLLTVGEPTTPIYMAT